MQQIVDLENDPEFQQTGAAFVSIAFDTLEELSAGKTEFGIGATPLLSDPDHLVSQAYDVLKWAVRTGEPGHTFILVDGQGKIAWIRDYGSPTLPEPTMYVPTGELVQQITESLR